MKMIMVMIMTMTMTMIEDDDGFTVLHCTSDVGGGGRDLLHMDGS
jgi:hypothetical protein